jgi:hypothetical protein
MGRRIILTPNGINLLEQIIAREFIEHPDEIREAAEILGLKLNPILQRNLKRYFEIEEDLSRIRTGKKPIYNSVEYYTGKK